MTGETTENIDFSTYLLKMKLYRRAARIAYNVAVAQPAIEAGIAITSVQLCNMPDTAPLYDETDRTPDDTEFHASEERPAEEGGIAAHGTFYMLPNRQGAVPSIAEQSQKNRQNAPTNAAYLRIGATKAGAALEYIVYLGANNTDDFNVNANEAHTYDVTIWSDTQTDTRITRYLLECDDRWPGNRYSSVSDKGVLAYTVENTTDHTLVGRFTLLHGETEALTVTEGNEVRKAPCEFSVTTHGQLGLAYAPTLIREGKNSRLEYRTELMDETGRSVAYDFAHEFANRVEIYNPTGTSIDQITVGGALDQERTSEKAIAWCYEGGCDLTIAGERFDGWYADADFMQKLSSERTFRYVPTQAEGKVYARLAAPEATIICRETNKNSTYMYNDNAVDLTVADYSGTVTVRATCADGGVFAAGAEQTVSVVTGQRITLNPIRFVPLKAGSVTYVIEVHTADGQKIGTAEVSNTIKPTKLTPKIRVYYDEPERQRGYNLDGGFVTDSTAVYWYGYTKIKADVTFAPTVDYPEPFAGKTLAKIKLKPTPSVTRILSEWDILDTGPIWHAGWQFLNADNCPDLDEIEVVYAPAATPKSYCLMDIERIPDYSDNEHYPANSDEQLFAPYTEGYDDVIFPADEPNLDYGQLTNRVFVYYNFSSDIQNSEVSISAFYDGLDFDIKNPNKTIINELN
ncbi:MAG: DUF4906 domain-containing protein [Lachnospiraceae bacterium]|nr:DUF4906 domain-containing protein [Lachnospiraceae bacterium]